MNTATDLTSHRTTLHDHYAHNAIANGHADTCRKVTDDRNWPTIMGRPICTCGYDLIGGLYWPPSPTNANA